MEIKNDIPVYSFLDIEIIDLENHSWQWESMPDFFVLEIMPVDYYTVKMSRQRSVEAIINGFIQLATEYGYGNSMQTSLDNLNTEYYFERARGIHITAVPESKW